MMGYIGEISKVTPVLNKADNGYSAEKIFLERKDIEGIVVLAKGIPVGMISRNLFFKKLAGKYGYVLYTGRSIDIISDKEPFVCDYYCPIIDISTEAMSREQDKLYDPIIVTKGNYFYGTVVIKDLLLNFAEIQKNNAKFMSPLTGLPGNNLIKEKIEECLQKEEFTILYFDLDNFKPYNDRYGFGKGDDVIRFTADSISNICQEHKINHFLGHVGGDDFVLILYSYNFGRLIKDIFDEFNLKIKNFYAYEDIKNGFLYEKIDWVKLKNIKFYLCQ